MKRLNGFSLMEMMVVLTIVAIVAAASAPMVNKKMVRAASEKSPWIFTNGESIGYNIDNEGGIQDRKTATIGNNGRVPNGAGNPRLYIDINSDATPHILFGSRIGNFMRLIAGGDKNSVWLTSADIAGIAPNTVAIGPAARATDNNAVAIGNNARATFVNAIAIGNNAFSDTDDNIAIGRNARASDTGGVAIGAASIASSGIGICGTARGTSSIALLGQTPNIATDSIAIGNGAIANQIRSIAIGRSTQAMGNGGIALGFNTSAAANAVAIGSSSPAGVVTQASASNSIAIGFNAGVNAAATGAIAIGQEARASGVNSVAIGRKANVATPNTIVLGTTDTIVRIPGSLQIDNLTLRGNLVVEGDTLLGGRKGSKTYIRETDGQWIYNFRQCKNKVDRQGSRGSITAFDMQAKSPITINNVTYSNDGGGSADDGDDNEPVNPATQAKIDELTNKINTLESRIAALEAKLK